MVFNLQAAKAYVGALVATAAVPVTNFIVGMFESATGIDLPATFEGILLTGMTAVVGYVAVYMTPNKQA